MISFVGGLVLGGVVGAIVGCFGTLYLANKVSR